MGNDGAGTARIGGVSALSAGDIEPLMGMQNRIDDHARRTR